MSNRRRLLLLCTWCATACATMAQAFDEWFDGRTLRLDYVLAGDSKSQDIYFCQAYATPRWAGRRARLSETLLRGNGQLRVKDHTTGQVLYTHTFSTLFQEWQATDEAKSVRKAFETSYNVPMPRRKADIEIRLTDTHSRTAATMTHTIDPADILTRPIGDNAIPYYYIQQGGNDSLDIAGRIDLAIVAEGYTEAQMGKFYHDCQRAADALFAREPFRSLRDRFNVVAVASPSLDDGPSIPHTGKWSRTAAGTHYDTFYSERYLMLENMHRLYDLLSGVPFEHIIVLVNSSTYGGGGIYNQVTVTTSDHPTFSEVLVHEFGHGYGGLGDEYASNDGYDNYYPADTEPWEPNLTTLADFSQKWADMMPKDAKIPTPPAKIPDYRQVKNDEERRLLNAATQRVGVFEGGGYQTKGVYRPAQECRMKINEVEDFCPVCVRAIRRITDFYTSK